MRQQILVLEKKKKTANFIREMCYNHRIQFWLTVNDVFNLYLHDNNENNMDLIDYKTHEYWAEIGKRNIKGLNPHTLKNSIDNL